MFYKSFDDEVFAKFLNYMQKALLHKKLNYIRDYKKINEMECSFEGLDNVLQSNEKMDFDVCNFLSEKEQRVLKLHFKDKLTYKEIGEILGLQSESVRKIKYRTLKKLESRGYYNDKNEIQQIIKKCCD